MQFPSFVPRFFLNKFGWGFTIIHWILFAIAVYQRGDRIFHYIYEPILFKCIFVVDLFWFWIADELQVPSYFLVALFASIQWYLLGYLFGVIRNSRYGLRTTDD